MVKYAKASEAKAAIGVSATTLRRYRKEGKIRAVPTPGGHYRWEIPEQFEATTPVGEKKRICYVRVSSSKQRDDLERQAAYMSARFPDAEIIRDVGSGINFRRKGLLSVLQRVKDGDIGEVAVASRDRLCRFAFELLEWYFQQHKVMLVVLDSGDQSPEQELSDDLLSIVQVFCCRRNGRRRYKVNNSDDKDQAETDKGAEGETAEVC